MDKYSYLLYIRQFIQFSTINLKQTLKNIKSLLFISCVVGLLSCNVKSYEDNVLKYSVDSVEYHGIGQDNTLQTTPYLVDTNMQL